MTEAAGPLLKLLVAVSDWERAGKFTELLRNDALLHYQLKGEGTASSEILDMFGIGRSDKFISFCLIPAERTRRAQAIVAAQFKMNDKGKGIVFTMPISSAGVTLHRIFEEYKSKAGETGSMESIVPKQETAYELIMTVINKGYSSELMEAAQSAGAGGGTVFHAKRAGAEEPTRFLGIHVQAEKEVVLILAPRGDRTEIMKAISLRCGIKTEARGITLSLPVDSAYGLHDGHD